MKTFKKLTVLLLAMFLLFSCGYFAKTPDENQIKSDLIGQTMKFSNTFSIEKFTSLNNFKEFIIKNKSEQGDIIEFDISMIYEDTVNGTTDSIEAKIVYKKSDSKWNIVSITGTIQR